MLKPPIRWLPVVHPKGRMYEVNFRGEVRHKTFRKVLNPVIVTGYAYVSCSQGDGTCKRAPVHQLVCWTFHGPPPTEKHVPNHINGVKWDNTPKNLEWVTRAENVRHALENGLLVPRGPQGSQNSQSLLTEKDVVAIRVGYYQNRESVQALAYRYKVAKPTVYQILRGDSWGHVGGPTDKQGVRRGSQHYKARLTVEQVKHIKANRERGAMPLAKELGVPYSTVHSILTGNSWKHV